ncbi:hypothetical protein P7C71_g3587, partial [Lecanoromycetidae sp. Uapishka_2]
MGSPFTATSGSLAEYDVMLSISEEAINRQFKLLYNKEISTSDEVPPPSAIVLDDAASPPKAKYLINHEMEVHLAYEEEDGKKAIDYDTGIFGHIRCPFISLNVSGSSNTARISFRFKRDSNSKQPDSIFAYWVGIGKQAKVKKEVINDYTMSWDVKLGQRDIQNVTEELIKPAMSNNTPETLHPATLKGLEQVASEHFTVSAIFCTFEAAQIANTFILNDENGRPVSDTKQTEFMTKISGYFSLLQSKIQPGRATPDHPFVLGYGLSQRLPTLQSVNASATTDKTPTYLIPELYNLTVTPGFTMPAGHSDKQPSKFTHGTLNYCILTHRDEGDSWPMRELSMTDPSRNANSGRLDQTLFDTTRTAEHDGVMAFCRDLMFEKFLCRELGDAFFVNLNAIFEKAMEGTKYSRPVPTTTTSSLQTPVVADRPPHWSRYQPLEISDGKVEHTFLDDKVSVSGKRSRSDGVRKAMQAYKGAGTSTLTVTWESDLQTNPSIESPDALRQARVTVISHVVQDYHYTDTGLIHNDKYGANLDFCYKYCLIVSTGSGGLIDVVKDEENTVLPQYEPDGKLKLIQAKRQQHQFGAYYTTVKDESVWKTSMKVFLQILPGDAQQILETAFDTVQTRLAAQFGKTLSDVFKDKWQASIASFRNRVIMPAGNVFNFSGVDVDAQGNMYTHVSFAFGAEDVKQSSNDPVKGAQPNVAGAKPPL